MDGRSLAGACLLSVLLFRNPTDSLIKMNLITATKLQSLLDADQPPVLFDCRFSLMDFSLGKKLYEGGHIPGAFHLDMEDDLSGLKGLHGGRHPLPSAADFQQRMRDCGVNQDSLIVCYDDNRMAGAARAWWLLRYFGFTGVTLLNGGLNAWQEQDGRISKITPKATDVGDVTLVPGALPLVNREWVESHLDDDGIVLIDSREDFRFRGESEPVDSVAGRIPSAMNSPWQLVTDERGVMHPQAFLRKHFSRLPTENRAVVYCGSGVTAAVNALAMVEAGLTVPTLYNGSWSDWCSYSDTPKLQG